MPVHGIILRESLEHQDVLSDVSIVSEECWDNGWTAVQVEIESSQVDTFAERLATVLKTPGWYADLSGQGLVWVVFPRKVFKYQKGDADSRAKIVEYGRSIGIPDTQLDWPEDRI